MFGEADHGTKICSVNRTHNTCIGGTLSTFFKAIKLLYTLIVFSSWLLFDTVQPWELIAHSKNPQISNSLSQWSQSSFEKLFSSMFNVNKSNNCLITKSFIILTCAVSSQGYMIDNTNTKNQTSVHYRIKIHNSHDKIRNNYLYYLYSVERPLITKRMRYLFLYYNFVP